MMPDLETVETHCITSSAERELLKSRERPVVILRRRPGSPVAAEVAPRQETLGVMLPYTPLHYLLFEPQSGSDSVQPPNVLVMTSGNLSEEPIATDNEDARQRLSRLADAFLMHNRPIRTRCDDSVVRVADFGKEPPGETPARRAKEVVQYYRRSRGYAPSPISPWKPGCPSSGRGPKTPSASRVSDTLSQPPHRRSTNYKRSSPTQTGSSTSACSD
jgi:hydrogenase maturation protein HypF